MNLAPIQIEFEIARIKTRERRSRIVRHEWLSAEWYTVVGSFRQYGHELSHWFERFSQLELRSIGQATFLQKKGQIL